MNQFIDNYSSRLQEHNGKLSEDRKDWRRHIWSGLQGQRQNDGSNGGTQKNQIGHVRYCLLNLFIIREIKTGPV